MWRVLTIVLALLPNQCRTMKSERDTFMEKLESEFQGYEGRPMPPELAEMVTNHTLHNDDFEECMVELTECMTVHKFYVVCAKSNTKNVIKLFPNMCEYEYNSCMDGENSWQLLPDKACIHQNATQVSNREAIFADILKWDLKDPVNITEELEMEPDVIAEPKVEIQGKETTNDDSQVDTGVVAEPKEEIQGTETDKDNSQVNTGVIDEPKEEIQWTETSKDDSQANTGVIDEPKEEIQGKETPKDDSHSNPNVNLNKSVTTTDENTTKVEENKVEFNESSTIDANNQQVMHSIATQPTDLSFLRINPSSMHQTNTVSKTNIKHVPEMPRKPLINSQKKKELVDLLARLKRVFP